ncbi:MAG TPA: GNAT family N-acetyltransferase, partial [Arenicellales bacterium]|nr:GNAT family N-acetyltransferase [Arenicellales bacterium]
VGEDHRRAGFGQALYADLLAWAEGRTPRLACEVNTRPANEPSMRFHRQLGFEPVGIQDTDGGRKTVSLMIRELAGGGH